MATITSRPMTFEEFAQLPEREGVRYELHHGELVQMTPPDHPHIRAQWQIRRLLERQAGPNGFVDKEVPYRPLPEYEAWVADVGYMPLERWDGIRSCLRGAPELVIEVLSPSNTASEMSEKRRLCLTNGSIEFWLVDYQRREVEVYSREGRLATYTAGQQIPLFSAEGSTIDVDAIFA